MAITGKQFEQFFKENWKRCFPNSFIYRLPDSLSGYSGVGGSNPCDFFCFTNGKLLLVENKKHDGASLPFSAIRQYEKLLSYKGIKDVFPGVLCWLIDKDTVFWLPITEMEKMVTDGKKSVGLKDIEQKLYNIIVIPSVKKRVFMESDYKYLVDKLED